MSNLGQWPATLTLVLFAVTNAIIVFPFRVPIPKALATATHTLLVKGRVLAWSDEPPFRRIYLPFNLNTTPLTCVVILLAAGAISGVEVRAGILGANGVKPIDILALFISLAYISISLDAAGLFRYLACLVARRGGSSGARLYLYLYAFFLVCGVVVGNDPVILSGTAFLAYFTRVSGITPPTAWLFAQFAAANMGSAVLVSSNPTNLVLSGAFSLSFTAYTSRLIVPVILSSVAVYPVLTFVLFRSHHFIPRSVDLDLDGASGANQSDGISAALVDKPGAIIGCAIILVTLGVLVGTSTVGVPVWEVTVPPALLMLARDAWHDVSSRHSSPSRRIFGDLSSPIPLRDPPESPSASHITPGQPGSNGNRTLSNSLVAVHTKFSATIPTVSTILGRLPVSLVPFAFSMFILVQSLASQGWVELFATWWGGWVSRTGAVGAVGGMGLVSCLLCNFCGTNIGATLLLARVLQVHFARLPALESLDTHAQRAQSRERESAIYALALGSNYGAFTFTFSASLAGLLWRGLLRQKGIHVGRRQFLTLNMPIVLAAMFVGSAVLVGEVFWFPL